jgi:hypothetical protein
MHLGIFQILSAYMTTRTPLPILNTFNGSNQANQEEKEMNDMEKRRNLEILRQQADDQRKLRDQEKRDRFGSIGGGFFEGFGRSCR